MAKEITLPDGSVGEFPDDMSDDAIAGVLRKQYPPTAPTVDPGAAARKAAGEADMRRMANPQAGMPWYEKLAVGAGSSVAKAGEGLLGLADKAGIIDKGKQEDLAAMKENRGLYKANHPGGWAKAGEIGADLAMSALPVGVGGQVLNKALSGAGRFAPAIADIAANAGWSAATAPENRGMAGLAGGAGAAGGRVLNRALGGVVRPSEAAALPLATGARMTPGQAGEGIMGGAARAYENVMSKPLISGHFIREAQKRGLRDAPNSMAEPGLLDMPLKKLLTMGNMAKVATEIGGHKVTGGVGLPHATIALLGTTEPGRKFLLGQLPWQELVRSYPEIAAQVGRAGADAAQGE